MLQPTEKIWHNGRFVAGIDAQIHVLSHVVSYGSSVFEGVRCYETKQGPAVFRPHEHMRRLVDSAKILSDAVALFRGGTDQRAAGCDS